MANQAIALQARAPQGNFLAPAIQQGAQMINMMSQQRAAERQAAAQQQQMQLQMAQEGRAAAGEARAAELQPFTVSKAQADAMSAEQKTVLGFYDLTNEGLKRASTPEQAMVVANYLKEKFPGAASAVDQTISTLPSDPGQFEAWRRQTLFQSMSAKEQLSKKFIEQNTGTGTRQLEVSEYEPGAVAQELPGSRIDTGQEITYVKGPNGEVIPMPKRMAPAGGGLVGGARGGGAPLGAGIEQAAMQLSPGVIVSGRARTPERNAQVGGVPGSYHMSDNARDFQPVKGQTVAALAARLQPLKAQGFDVIAEGDHVHVEPGPRMGRAPAAGGGGVQFGVPVPGTGGPKTKDLTVQEQTSSYNISRLLRGAAAIKKAVETSPSANVPGATEAVVGSLPFISGAVNFTRGPQRQIVAAAQRDVLDALLYLATGAAYNKEQLEGQMESYIPAFSDAPEAIKSKRERLAQLVMDAKTRAGRAWTPKLDEAANTLFGPTAAAAPPAASPTAPKIGAVAEGYRFKGGNPADSKNWEKVR
jgi:type II secretory pathway pseudopilin PulG